MTSDTTAIRRTVQTYLDGLYQGDVDKLAEAFHPTCVLASEREGTLWAWPRDEWFHAVRNRASPQAQGLSRHDDILSIDQSGPTTAFVKLKCAVPPRFFTDYLTLLKIDGRWQIAQKTFAVEVREAAQAAAE